MITEDKEPSTKNANITKGKCMHVIDADKLLEVIDAGMTNSKVCFETEPINSKGEYDLVSDVIRRMDLFTYNQIEVIRNYIIKNMV